MILSALETNYFIYTVLNNDTFGGEHPEYGSREFGFERQHDGTIKIYTRAVSSPADILADKIGRHLQEGGWTSMVRGMGRTITKRGGAGAWRRRARSRPRSGRRGSESVGRRTQKKTHSKVGLEAPQHGLEPRT